MTRYDHREKRKSAKYIYKKDAPTTATTAFEAAALFLEEARDVDDATSAGEEKRWCWTRCCDDANIFFCFFYGEE